MKRALALYIPFLSTDRLRRRGKVGLATIAARGQTLRIVHVDRTACDQGVRPGQTLADAKACMPNLVTYHDDPAGDRRQLESLAIWADCLSPVVHIEDENTLIIDVTGCERLFGGESNLLNQAIAGLQEQGFTGRGAIADTLGGSWALAHVHPEPAVISEPGQIAVALASLPVWALRIDAATTETLASVGVETVSSLWHLPRSSLASRFGEALLDRMDQALGDMPEVLIPYRPPPVLTSRFRVGVPTTRIDRLSEAMGHALERFCEQLTRRLAGVRQIFLTFYCPDVITEADSDTRMVTRHVDLSQPTRSVNHLFSLLRVLLENSRLPGPVDSMMLWAREIDPLDDWQGELFTTEAGDARGLGDLLDRLAIRLGPDAVVGVRLLSEHQPERAFRYVPLVGTKGTPPRRAAGFRRGNASEGLAGTSALENPPGPKSKARRGGTPARFESSPGTRSAARSGREDIAQPGPRPLRVSPHPMEVAATSIVPEGPPISFRLQGTCHTVAESVGVERIETGWWRGPHLQRDYYRVTTEAGIRCWIFRDRDTGRWFLHGWFD